MKPISEEYRLGIEKIDEEHAYLLELTNRSQKLFEDENMLFKCADIREILKGLSVYAEKHFVHEEGIMWEMGYPHLDVHKAEHAMFLKKLEEYTEWVDKLNIGTQDDMIHDLLLYLQSWLQIHIKMEDRKYAEFSKERENA